MNITIDGQLEIDTESGVIYFHGNESDGFNITMLRICGLPTPIPNPSKYDSEPLDITLKFGKVNLNWQKKAE